MSDRLPMNAAWNELPPKYSTDKIPPRWYVGCGWEYRKYRDMCNEWRTLAAVMKDKQKIVAIRFRLKGTAYDTAMAAPRPADQVPGPVQEDGNAGPLQDQEDTEYWRVHWEHMDTKLSLIHI